MVVYRIQNGCPSVRLLALNSRGTCIDTTHRLAWLELDAESDDKEAPATANVTSSASFVPPPHFAPRRNDHETGSSTVHV